MSDAGFQRVAVIGAGTMGNGIAQTFASFGAEVVLIDVLEPALKKGLAAIEKSLGRFAEKGKITPADARASLARVKPSTTLQDAQGAELVVEAVVEKLEVKRKVFQDLDALAPSATILATNTSSISITEIGAATQRADRVIGMHFMNPVPVMKLVEIVRGLPTSQETYDTVVELARRFGKTTIGARDIPGFIVNRMLIPLLNEACYGLYEGLGTAADIDTGVRLGLNHPMGPLELSDLIGLDTCLAVMQVLYEGLADSKYRPCPLLVKYVEAGWLGKKAGRGFYDYRGAKPLPTR